MTAYTLVEIRDKKEVVIGTYRSMLALKNAHKKYKNKYPNREYIMKCDQHRYVG